MSVELADIGEGDIVRLRNGEQVAVRSVSLSYHDREGEHVGPFVMVGRGRDRYHLGDVAEVAVKNPNRCKLCGRGVTAKDPSRYPYCSGCHYTGAAEEDLRSKQLDRLRSLLPGAFVTVEHTGGGCFWLAITWPGERGFYMATDGDAVLPESHDGGWGFLGWDRRDAEDDRWAKQLYYDDGQRMSDAALAAAILADRAVREGLPR